MRQKAANYDQKKVSVPVTVRTLESMIRLATAHAKLRLGTHVDVEDLDIACKLLNMTIFNEAEKEEQEADAEMEEQSAEEAPKDDDVVPLAKKAGRAMRARRRGGASKDNDEDSEEVVQANTASKRAKLDHKEEVAQLFGASAAIVDDQQKRLLFKLCGSLAGNANKTTTDAIWKRYMTLNERESTRKGTNEPLIGNKEEMIRILEALERDNLIMYAAEDN